MSFRTIEMKIPVCDQCGTEYEEAYGDEFTALEMAIDDGDWCQIDDKIYCNECWEYDDDDNPIPKPPTTA